MEGRVAEESGMRRIDLDRHLRVASIHVYICTSPLGSSPRLENSMGLWWPPRCVGGYFFTRF